MKYLKYYIRTPFFYFREKWFVHIFLYAVTNCIYNGFKVKRWIYNKIKKSDTSTLPTAPLSVRLCHRNTPELCAFGFYLKSARNLNCFVAWYNTNKATDIVLESSNLRIGKRFEDCISWNKVLSNDWTNFIIQISNTFFNT